MPPKKPAKMKAVGPASSMKATSTNAMMTLILLKSWMPRLIPVIAETV